MLTPSTYNVLTKGCNVRSLSFIREKFLNLQLANWHQLKAEVMRIQGMDCTQFLKIMIRRNSGFRAGLW